MHPELFRLTFSAFVLPFGSYGVLVVAGLAAGISLACLRARRYGLQAFDVFAASALATVGGLLGALGLDLIVQWRLVLSGEYPWDQPGVVFLGGLLGGIGATLAYGRAFGIPMLAVADAAAPGIALGHAFGRVGCLLGGCCYGCPLQGNPAFGVELAGAVRHPVQLYEAAALLLLVGGLLVWTPRLRRSGMPFAAYLIAYAVVRSLTEQFRGDNDARGFVIPGWLSTSQAISVGLLVAGLLLWRRRAA